MKEGEGEWRMKEGGRVGNKGGRRNRKGEERERQVFSCLV